MAASQTLSILMGPKSSKTVPEAVHYTSNARIARLDFTLTMIKRIATLAMVNTIELALSATRTNASNAKTGSL